MHLNQKSKQQQTNQIPLPDMKKKATKKKLIKPKKMKKKNEKKMKGNKTKQNKQTQHNLKEKKIQLIFLHLKL